MTAAGSVFLRLPLTEEEERHISVPGSLRLDLGL